MRRVFLLILGCLTVCSAFAQKTGTVYGKGSEKITINLSSYRTGNDTASKTFLSTLRADLNRSGYFKVTSSGAELNVVGSSVSGGGNMKAECQVFKVSNRQRLLGKSYTATAAEARTLAHKVADEILFAVTGKKGMASGKIALVSSRTGRKELYVCDIDGKNLRQITNDRSIVVGAGWTPDAKNIVYTSYKRGYPNVYMTGRSKPLSSHGGLNASGAISPNGKSLAVILSRDGNPELYIKSLRTGSLKRLTRTRGTEASPCWSPDGNHIAYVSDDRGSPQIYIIAKSGGRSQRLTSTGSENVAPDWSSNGYIAFSTRVGGRYRVAIANPAAKTLRVLDTDWADYEDPSWAPDGRHIVCSRTSQYRSSIYLLDTLKDSPVALLTGSVDWYSPACSP
jgi:TolB protein